MVCSHSLAGVAPGEAPKGEATELAPEAVGASDHGLDGTTCSTRRFPTVRVWPLDSHWVFGGGA
jgi:hypothetical protein